MTSEPPPERPWGAPGHDPWDQRYQPNFALPEPRHLASPPPSRAWPNVLRMLAILVAIAVAAVVGAHYFGGADLPRLVITPSRSASAKPSASASGSAKPSATMPSAPLDILKKNPIYPLKVTAHCPAQSVPDSSDDFRTQVAGLVKCQNTAWRKALAGTPITFSAPHQKYYGASLKTPCGTITTTFPASYCTANRTLYFSKAAYTQGRYYRLAVAEFVIHEYAHHIQNLAKIFDHTSAMKERDATVSRRIELQAHCMAQYGLVHGGMSFSAGDRADLEYQFGYTSDPDGHGSAKAERYWGRRGLDAKVIGACNTWKAKADLVK